MGWPSEKGPQEAGSYGVQQEGPRFRGGGGPGGDTLLFQDLSLKVEQQVTRTHRKAGHGAWGAVAHFTLRKREA